MERPHRMPEWLRHVLIVVALVLQVQVVWQTFLMGMGGWRGWTYILANGQALVALVSVVWVGRRRPTLVLLVPLVSILITFGLSDLFHSLIEPS